VLGDQVFAPDPCGRAYNASPDSPASFRGQKGRKKEKRVRKGRGRPEMGKSNGEAENPSEFENKSTPMLLRI